MSQSGSQAILKKGLKKLKEEYERINVPVPVAKYFGINPGWNAVIGTRKCCGVAMSFQDNNPLYGNDETAQDISLLESYIGKSLFEVAEDTMKDDLLSRHSIALASLNALSQPFVTDEMLNSKGYKTGFEVKEMVKPTDNLVIVGYGGLVKSYAGRCKELHVTDQRPAETFQTTIIGDSIIKGPLGITVHPADENREVLENADVALITGSTLVNGTFDEVFGYAKNARIRAIYGSSAQLIPDVLFENNVNIAMSVAISDPERFEHDVLNAPDMEMALRKHQRKYNTGCF
ncbi:uncharacterized protein (DUF4213/DUF364 family) [Methanomicrobium sp. W14]|uniref:Rossmann-like domain-containing protein n=1 Tax=Methanomicrobium sp. W14 TaxID=2817839 RepID=UPI001AEAE545|nr:DUF364 domain-containing protein [Methanomicrobium sp. W14]MBP2134023.1 uncharacterized protein (DUF4213/DUF364 family) [Methanomicrobium sp. W14]